MAATYRTSVAAGAVGSGNIVAAITPAIGDLLIAFAILEDGSVTVPTIADNNTSGAVSGWTLITNLSLGGTQRTYLWVRTSIIQNTTATNVTVGQPGTSNGGELIVVAYSGMTAGGAHAVRQSNAQSSGVSQAPFTTFGSAALTGNPTLSFVGCQTNPPGLTATASWTRQQNVGQTVPVGATVETRDSGFTGTTITWGTAVANWIAIGIELNSTAQQSYTIPVAGTGPTFYEQPVGPFSFVGPFGIATNIGLVVNGLRSLREMQDAKQNTAKTFVVLLRDAATGAGAALSSGLVAALTFSLVKSGQTNYSTITPVTQIIGTKGLLAVTLTSTHLNTEGIASVHIEGTNGIIAIIPNDDLIIDVGAVDKYDATRYGLAALPNVAAGALGGLAPSALHSGTAQGAGSGSNQIQLDVGASSTDGFYARTLIVLTGGTGAGQSRFIAHYVGSTQMATVSKNWATVPDNTTQWIIIALSNSLLTEGLAQAGAAASITLATNASSVNDTHKGQWIHLTAGTGSGQTRMCVGYNGTTKVALVDRDWVTNPDGTTVYQMLTGAMGQMPAGALKPEGVLDNYTYNTQGSPTAWRERTFADATAASAAYAAINITTGQGNADGADGEIEREKYTAEYDATTGKKLVGLKRLKEL